MNTLSVKRPFNGGAVNCRSQTAVTLYGGVKNAKVHNRIEHE